MTGCDFGRRPLLLGAASLGRNRNTPSHRCAACHPPRLGDDVPGHLIPVLFPDPAQFGLKHYGSSYSVQCILFRGSSLRLTAVAGGELGMFASAASTPNA